MVVSILVSSNIVPWSGGFFFPSRALIVILNQNGDWGEMRKKKFSFLLLGVMKIVRDVCLFHFDPRLG
jgi:hypothetical protein